MGFFSFKTSNTNKSIPNAHTGRKMIPVLMVAPDGRTWQEDFYDGYGVFGGKDFYELLAEINGYSSRSKGINIHLHPENYEGKDIKYPQLLEISDHTKEYQCDFSKAPEVCPHQGFFY